MKAQIKSEKERLELIDKRVDIQKKRLEVRKEKLNMDEKKLKSSIAIDEQKLLLDKIGSLKNLLGDITIDDERTIMGSEPFYKPTINGRDRNIVANKLIDLVAKL
jgi:hypothetical protein